MLNLLLSKKINRFSLLPLLLSLILVLIFQNCDKLVLTEDISNQASGNGQGYDGLTSSGNGQGYDGFAATTGVYYQYIDQIKCNGSSNTTYSSKIDFGTVSAPLNPPQVYNNECSSSGAINLSADYLSYKPYSDRIITFEKGIYEKFSATPTNVSNAPVAFCQTTANVNTGVDVLIRRNSAGGDYTAEIYLGLEQQNSSFKYEKRYIQKFNVTKSEASLSNTVYRADHFNLLSRTPNSNGISDGSLSTTIDGVNYSNLSIICKQQAPVSETLLPRAPVSNAPPTADFSFSCNNLTCDFTNLSTDSDGRIASSSWSFGDGAGSALMNANHTYAGAGMYSVSLTVTDSGGSTATVTKSVSVTSAPATGPTITLILAVDGGFDNVILANNTTINFSVQRLGLGTNARVWTASVNRTSSAVTPPTCPAVASYLSASSQGWVMDSSDNWSLSQTFSANAGVTKFLVYCFYNTSSGISSSVNLTVNP